MRLFRWYTRPRYPALLSEREVAVRKGSLAPRFFSEGDPVVSIIVPVYGKYALTWACLESLASSKCEVSFEVIVIDDASLDKTRESLAGVEGIRLYTNQSNLGFIGSCNRGASLARGTYLYFLNNDTRVTSGWLDELVRTLRSDPGIGIVGSQLLFPDGRLQEAGGTLFRGGSGFHLGRNRDPGRPEYNFARDVDYVSGASLLISKLLFDELGGFDAYYAPAYYEDADLALRVWNRGLRVRYQPLSKVVHYEGMTNGRSEKSGVKRYQLLNRSKFVERWSSKLNSTHPPDGWRTIAAATYRQKRKVLVVCARAPQVDSGEFEQLAQLSAQGFHVSLWSTRGSAPPGNSLLARLGIEVLYPPYIPSLRHAVQEVVRRGEVCVWLWLWEPTEVQAFLKVVRNWAPTVRVFGRRRIEGGDTELRFFTTSMHGFVDEGATEFSAFEAPGPPTNTE